MSHCILQHDNYEVEKHIAVDEYYQMQMYVHPLLYCKLIGIPLCVQHLSKPQAIKGSFPLYSAIIPVSLLHWVNRMSNNFITFHCKTACTFVLKADCCLLVFTNRTYA
jgi:hypothetical protein